MDCQLVPPPVNKTGATALPHMGIGVRIATIIIIIIFMIMIMFMSAARFDLVSTWMGDRLLDT